MKYLLDTNVCIRFLSGRNQNILKMFQVTAPKERVIPSVVRGELYYGASKSNRKDETLQNLEIFFNIHPHLDFDNEAAKIYGEIRALLEQKGKPIGPYDLQIAAISIVNNLILVTHNVDEFSRISGLSIQDWEKAEL